MTAAAGIKAVALGGGTGLPRVLTALLTLGCETTAVVTMADDGGSSGRLREDLGILPPGDVRNCLVALGTNEALGAVFQYRFPHGEGLAGHALGNLLLAALTDVTGDFTEAIGLAGELLGSRGRVLPSTLEDVRLIAVDREGQPISGQVTIANSAVPIAHVELDPAAPAAHPPVLEALSSADLVVVGPGSLFTSIIPNLLVGGIADTLRESGARRVYVCNVANQRGETSGMGASEHVNALLSHGLEGAIDVVLLHDQRATCREPHCVDVGPEERARIVARGLEVAVADVVDPADRRHHESLLLARALQGVL